MRNLAKKIRCDVEIKIQCIDCQEYFIQHRSYTKKVGDSRVIWDGIADRCNKCSEKYWNAKRKKEKQIQTGRYVEKNDGMFQTKYCCGKPYTSNWGR